MLLKETRLNGYSEVEKGPKDRLKRKVLQDCSNTDDDESNLRARVMNKKNGHKNK